ncbi:hypothetical protein LUX09_33435 [Streptomyces albogriseolus]|nr:hypothetical protein [Streptomyces albogriseolus]
MRSTASIAATASALRGSRTPTRSPGRTPACSRPGGERVDPGVQFAVAPAQAVGLDRGGVAAVGGALAQQGVDVGVGDRVVGRVEEVQCGAGARADAVQRVDGPLGFGDELGGERGDVLGERLGRRRLQAGRVVLEPAVQPALPLVQLQGEQAEAGGVHVLAPVGAQAVAQGDAVGGGGAGLGPAVQYEGAVEHRRAGAVGRECRDPRERQPGVVDGAGEFPLHGGDVAGRGQLGGGLRGADQQGADEVADGAVEAGVGAGAERHADGGGVLTAVGGQGLEVGGEQDGGGAGAVGAGEGADPVPGAGVQFQGDGRLARGAVAAVAAGDVEREVDGEVGPVEPLPPVRLGDPGGGGGLGGTVGGIGVEARLGGGSWHLAVVVGGEQVGEEDAGGLAVDGEVVHDEQEGVVAGAVRHQHGAQDAVALQVQLPAGLGGHGLGGPDAVRAGARGAPLQPGGASGIEVEGGQAVAVRVVDDPRGQQGVAGDEPGEGGLQGGRVERAGEVDGERHVVGRGSGVGAVLKQQPQLVLGQRQRPCPVRPASGGRGGLLARRVELGHRGSPGSDPRPLPGCAHPVASVPGCSGAVLTGS